MKLVDALRWACVLEASAAKPGNVHPQASFEDLTYDDFVRSADAVAPVLARARELGVGRTIFDAIQATRNVVASNTNLGIVLLLAPLAAVPADQSLRDGIGDVLNSLTRDDASWVYRAIRAANPGGLGSASEEDVASEPAGTLREVMVLAADRDGVAAQYAHDFAWVLDEGVPFMRTQCENRLDLELPISKAMSASIVELQLRLLAAHPDTLIARKCGNAIAKEVSQRAAILLEAGELTSLAGQRRLAEFDLWLRADGHRRNPGTTADLITACLFATIREAQ